MVTLTQLVTNWRAVSVRTFFLMFCFEIILQSNGMILDPLKYKSWIVEMAIFYTKYCLPMCKKCHFMLTCKILIKILQINLVYSMVQLSFDIIFKITALKLKKFFIFSLNFDDQNHFTWSISKVVFILQMA